MSNEPNKTVPIRRIEDLIKFRNHLALNYDPFYLLVFDIAVNTGLRIGDILSLRYKENIFANQISIYESKLKLGAIAKRRSKIINDYRETLLINCNDQQERIRLTKATANELYEKLTPDQKLLADVAINNGVQAIKHKKRTCNIPDDLAQAIQLHAKQHKKHDEGYLFSVHNLKSNRCHKKSGTVSRQSAWRVMRDTGRAVGFDFPTSCHGMRKSFICFLYSSSGNNSALTIKEVGWADEKLLQVYLAVETKERASMVAKMQAEIQGQNYPL